MQETDEPVDDVLAADDADGSLRALDRVVVTNLPGATRRVWRGVFWGGTTQTIIGYGSILQPRPGGEPVRWFLIGLARQKRYVSLYVNAADEHGYLAKRYGPLLGNTKVGSASISFRSADDLDESLLGEMIRAAGSAAEWH